MAYNHRKDLLSGLELTTLPEDLSWGFPPELLCCVLQHLRLGAVDLHLGRPDDGDGDALAGVDPGTVDLKIFTLNPEYSRKYLIKYFRHLQSHRVERNPLDCLNAGEDEGAPSSNKVRFPSLIITENLNYSRLHVRSD